MFLCIAWIPSGGFQGIIPYMILLVYTLAFLILPSKPSIVFGSFCFIAVVVFAFLEISNPELAPPYLKVSRRITDISVANILALIIFGAFIYLFKKAHQSDRFKIIRFNEELSKEKIRAESADKAKSQFLTTISHEMRTPLNGIVGISDLLFKTALTEEQHQMVKNLVISSELLHSLISDVLDLSQIEEGKLVLNNTAFNLKNELDTVLSIFELRVKQKNLFLNYEHDDRINKEIIGDALRMKQVIINIVNNAIKFTSTGGVSIKTQLLEQSDEDYTIKFTIQDTGVGIPEEKQMQLFSKFYKVDTPHHANQEGTGLGLAISKNLVEFMGGEIDMSSTYEVGSSFFFTLNFKTAATINNHNSNQQPKCDLAFQALKVLIAEDYEINRMVAKKMLHNLGITTIDMAKNGLLAIEKAKSKPYDLILMDIQMPELNGIEATKQILKYFKDHKADEKPPVIIALTANAFEDEVSHCLSVGMSHFISKPFTLESLKSAIYNYVIV